MKSFLIIGMGSFGHHLCRCLAKEKCEIMIVDECQEKIEDMLPYVASAKIGDCTNIEVLRSFDIPSFDACFVCIGTSFQNSLEITSLLKELGAKKVFSKADRDIQVKFLLKNGADEVIYPEKDVASRIALRESSYNIFDFIQLSKEYSIVELRPLDKWIGKSVRELNFRVKYHLTILASVKNGEITPIQNADYTIRDDEHIMVLGHEEDVRKALK